MSLFSRRQYIKNSLLYWSRFVLRSSSHKKHLNVNNIKKISLKKRSIVYTNLSISIFSHFSTFFFHRIEFRFIKFQLFMYVNIRFKFFICSVILFTWIVINVTNFIISMINVFDVFWIATKTTICIRNFEFYFFIIFWTKRTNDNLKIKNSIVFCIFLISRKIRIKNVWTS